MYTCANLHTDANCVYTYKYLREQIGPCLRGARCYKKPNCREFTKSGFKYNYIHVLVHDLYMFLGTVLEFMRIFILWSYISHSLDE